MNRLQRWLSDQPIRFKFWLGSNLATALALALAATMVTVQQAHSFRDAAIRDLTVFSDVLAQNAAAAVTFDDAAAAQNLLNSLTANPDIIHAEIKPLHRPALAGYQLANHESLVRYLRDRPETQFSNWSGVKLVRPILLHDEPIGALELHATLDAIRQQLLDFATALLAGVLVALFASLMVIHGIGELIARPLKRLAMLMQQVSKASDYHLRADDSSGDEVGDLSRGFNQMISQIEARDAALEKELTQRKSAEAELARMAHYDAVTGLPNRHYFNERLKRLVNAPEHATVRTAAVLFFDLDNFKKVNDTLGHAAGDTLLQEVARRLGAGLRSTDTLCRLGGDEFAVLVEHLDQRQYLERICEKSLEIVRRPFTLEGENVFISASIGVSVFPDDGRDSASLLRNADTAMYHAKNSGKNNFAMFRMEMNEVAVRSVALESKLRRAITDDLFEVHYQPQIEPVSGTIHALEALVRWNDPERGLVPPEEFIQFAEQNGLIKAIGAMVLRTACVQLKQWHDAGHLGLAMTVNISAEQVREHDFVEQVRQVLDECGLAPHALMLELTETTVMDSDRACMERLNELHAAGIQIAIDDFGTGYSSMAYLKRYPISLLKIDRSFVQDLPDDPEDRAISAAIITMAHSLGLPVCAEGVENLEQARYLLGRECDLMQGFYFSKARPAGAITALLSQSMPVARPEMIA